MKSHPFLSRSHDLQYLTQFNKAGYAVRSIKAMIAGLCESPLTFQAIIIWRDELNDGKVFLRGIIDLEATYAGPDAKGVPVMPGADGQAPSRARWPSSR